MAMDVFIRDDGRPIAVAKGFRKAVRSYRSPVIHPSPDWSAGDYTEMARQRRKRFGRLLAAIVRWRGTAEGAEVLDVGCGDGMNSLLMALHPVRRVVGIDLHLQLLDPAPASEPVRRLADEVLRQSGFAGGVRIALKQLPVNLAVTDARRTGFPDGAFDLLLSRSAMEHLMPIEAALAEMARVVRPGGLIHHSIDPFYWLRGCHKRGIADIPWAHARLSMAEFARFVAEHETPEKAEKRVERLRTLNRLTARQWREVIEAGPFEVLHWEQPPSAYAEEVLQAHPDVPESLLPGVTRADLTSGRIDVWLRRPG